MLAFICILFKDKGIFTVQSTCCFLKNGGLDKVVVGGSEKQSDFRYLLMIEQIGLVKMHRGKYYRKTIYKC